MKSRETLIRLKKFQVDEKRRRVAQIEGMIAEFDRIAGDLEREIKTEQDRAGIHDPGAFRLSDLCQGRDAAAREPQALGVRASHASSTRRRRHLGEAFEELKKVELLDERDQMRERAEEEAREQAELDAIGMMRNGARA